MKRFGLAFLLATGVSGWLGSQTGAMPPKDAGAADDPPQLKLPAWWKAGDPLPGEKSNCVRCHLNAGRELTAPLRDFARSVHDRAKLSCNDCHGGDTEHDATAHEHDKGFIGTKLSAHMAACSSCHGTEANAFRKSKHYWDLKKSINRDYPVCVDCHGNHDIGKPPAEFAMTNVCTDCHKNLATRWPALAAVTNENDRLWQTLRKVHAKSKAPNPTPEPFGETLADLRQETGKLMHGAKAPTKEEAESLNRRVIRLREDLEDWLKKHP
jgi:Cytochrome c3